MNQNIIVRMIENIRTLIRRITNIMKMRIVGNGTVLIPKRLWSVRWDAIEILHGSLMKEVISSLENFENPPYSISKADRLIIPIREQYQSLKKSLTIAIEKSTTHEDRLRAIPTKNILQNLEDIEKINNMADRLLKKFNTYSRNVNERGWVNVVEQLCASVIGMMQLMTQIENVVINRNMNQ